MSSVDPNHNPIVLFDGVCNLCNSSVQFVIKRDKKNIFKFASLQSETGQLLLQEYNSYKAELTSIVFLDKGKLYSRSTAALKIAGKLSGAWPLVSVFLLIPRFIRDAVYNYIASHRYKWFGKKEECWVPSPSLKNKFL